MGLFDLFKKQERTPKEFEAWLKTQVSYGFGDYWWLRDNFIRMMLDIKGPIDEPWYNRRSVHLHITLWQHPHIMQAIRVRLTQLDRMDEYGRFESLHKMAVENRDFFANFFGPDTDIEPVHAFLDEASIALYSVDKWFARRYWPDGFKPTDNQGEFETISIQTAMMHAPFRR